MTELEKHYLATVNNNSGKEHQWMLEVVNKKFNERIFT